MVGAEDIGYRVNRVKRKWRKEEGGNIFVPLVLLLMMLGKWIL